MANPTRAAAASTSTTVTVVETTDGQPATETVQMTLRKPRTERKVQWSNETVDNEHMNKKKSKCCCIYKKPREFEESSSEDSDEECNHCSHHVEKKALKLRQLEAEAAVCEVINDVLNDIPPDKSPVDPDADPDQPENEPDE